MIIIFVGVLLLQKTTITTIHKIMSYTISSDNYIDI